MRGQRLFLVKAERVFLLISVIFGITFVFLTPPFQSPDENRHFYRAYHVAQGSPFAEQMDGRVGGFLPKKIRESLVPFSGMRGQIEGITSREEIVSHIGKEVDNSKEFVDFPSVAVYTPVSYLPQAVGIRIASLFSDSPLIALYLGRIVVLFCWILAIYYAIKTTPIFKWLFVALALLPMSIYISASLSSDTVTNAIAFLLLANFLKQAFADVKQSNRDFILLGILVFLLSSAKFIYSPLILLFFLIPAKNFDSKKQYFFRFFLLGVIALLTSVCWPLIQGVGYVPYAEYNPNYSETVNLLECSNFHEQLAYILNHGGYIFTIIGNSVVQSFDAYFIGFIGNFGWGESPLPTFWLILAYLGLMVISLFDGRTEITINAPRRLLVLLTFSVIFALVIISQLLIWTCVGNDVVGNLQGRYFVPAAPLLFFTFYRSSIKWKKYLPFGVIIFSATLLFVSTKIIYERFYVPLEYSTEEIFCDHEAGEGNSDFGTSNPKVVATNGYSRSNEQARSGNHSSKITPKVPYGTLIKLQNCNGGDALEVEAWRYGPNGKMVVSVGGGELFSRAESEPDYISGNWQRIRFWVRIPPNVKNEEVGCFASYFEETDSCYFDDIKVTLNRLK